MFKIKSVLGREIIDSRGNPTVEAEVRLKDGSIGIASAPSGASVGSREALELRDNDNNRFLGKGVIQAVNAINGPIMRALIGKDAREQYIIDSIMIELDGTCDKSKFGANSILSVSLATAKAAACFKKVNLYEHISDLNGTSQHFTMPLPMMNILNGGRHANNNIDIQEFMIQPVNAVNMKDAIRMGVEIFHSLGNILNKRNISIVFGDEGGFAPNLESNVIAFDLIQEAVESIGYVLGKDVTLAIDCAASELFDASVSKYKIHSKNEYVFFTSEEFVHFLEKLSQIYPILSIEDGLSELDWKGFMYFTKKLGSKIQLVGDDLFVTNVDILKQGILDGIANAILIKPNQIGSLTETLAAIKLAKDAGYATIISHRSGETEDTTIADLAVGTAAGQIKTGSLRGSDRLSKYNRLIRIEEYLKFQVPFLGMKEIKNQI